MNQPQMDIPVRAPSATSADDTVLPFEIGALDLRGRVVRLGSAVDTILNGHNYPQPVAKLLGEAIALTVMLGTSLKFEGRFILQTQTDGPVRMLVVDFRSPGQVRACARFDKARVAGLIDSGKTSAADLLGHGHLAMTIDQGADMNRYQGLVALNGGTLEDAAHEYFKSSEQIPTRVRLAVAEEMSPGLGHRWRAGGLMLQFLPKAPERARVADLHPGDPHVVAGGEAGLDIGERGLVVAEIRFLRQIADRRAGLHEARAAVGLDKTCGDLEEGRLPGSGGPGDDGDVPGGQVELQVGPQRRRTGVGCLSWCMYWVRRNMAFPSQSASRRPVFFRMRVE